MVDEFLVPLYVVENEISIVFGRRREYDHLEMLAHILQKLYAARSQLELFLLGLEMNQGLVQIQHQSVCLLVFVSIFGHESRQVMLRH